MTPDEVKKLMAILKEITTSLESIETKLGEINNNLFMAMK